LEYFVHHGLEGSWAVCEAKVHDQWFKETSMCPEGGLLLIALSDADIIVSPSYIELGEVLHTFESMDEIVDEGEGVLILSRDGIECSIFLDEAEFTILLLDEEKKTGAPNRDFDCLMQPVARASSKNASISVCSVSVIG
jgi:hypothetical protein